MVGTLVKNLVATMIDPENKHVGRVCADLSMLVGRYGKDIDLPAIYDAVGLAMKAECDAMAECARDLLARVDEIGHCDKSDCVGKDDSEEFFGQNGPDIAEKILSGGSTTVDIARRLGVTKLVNDKRESNISVTIKTKGYIRKLRQA